jgi:hypothetical protein
LWQEFPGFRPEIAVGEAAERLEARLTMTPLQPVVDQVLEYRGLESHRIGGSDDRVGSAGSEQRFVHCVAKRLGSGGVKGTRLCRR